MDAQQALISRGFEGSRCRVCFKSSCYEVVENFLKKKLYFSHCFVPALGPIRPRQAITFGSHYEF